MHLPVPQSFPSLTETDPADTLVDSGAATLNDAGKGRPDGAPAPAPTVDDARWGMRLVRLLGRLEVHREELRRTAHVANYAPALRIATGLVSELLAFDGSPEDPEAVRAAVRFVTAARTTGLDVGRGRFFGLKRITLGPAERDQCAWVLRDLICVLDNYFRLLADQFRSPAARAEWVTMSAEFSAGVIALLRTIDETV